MSNQLKFSDWQIVKVQSISGVIALRITEIGPVLIRATPMRKDKMPKARGSYLYNPVSNPLKPLDESDELIWDIGQWKVVAKNTGAEQ